jgi:hypothetical protein
MQYEPVYVRSQLGDHEGHPVCHKARKLSERPGEPLELVGRRHGTLKFLRRREGGLELQVALHGGPAFRSPPQPLLGDPSACVKCKSV